MDLAMRVAKAGDQLETFQRGTGTGRSGIGGLLFGTRIRPGGGETKRPLILLLVFVSLSMGFREAILGKKLAQVELSPGEENPCGPIGVSRRATPRKS